MPSLFSPAGAKGVSCVPCGEYRLVPHDSEAHPRVWAFFNSALDIYHWDFEVPKDRAGIARTVCLIHIANYAAELRGCIAAGKTRVKDQQGRWMVANSRDAINEIRSCIGSTLDMKLTIQEGL